MGAENGALGPVRQIVPDRTTRCRADEQRIRHRFGQSTSNARFARDARWAGVLGRSLNPRATRGSRATGVIHSQLGAEPALSQTKVQRDGLRANQFNAEVTRFSGAGRLIEHQTRS